MRTIQTFILRLFIDTEAPEEVRGALQALNEKEEPIPFRHEAALVALLKRLAMEQCGYRTPGGYKTPGGCKTPVALNSEEIENTDLNRPADELRSAEKLHPKEN
jgi:hypothetical protein